METLKIFGFIALLIMGAMALGTFMSGERSVPEMTDTGRSLKPDFIETDNPARLPQ